MLGFRGIFLRCALALLFVAILGACHKSKRNDSDLRQWNDLINESLPRGSTRAEVEKFLDQHHIAHSYMDKSNFPDQGNSEVALIRTSDEGGIVRRVGIELKFKFDTDGRLRSFESREAFTGP